MRFVHRVLWIDCTAALLAGLAFLAFARWLSPWYVLPSGLLLGMGAVNLVYAAYTFSLARRARRPRPLLVALSVANAVWAGGCAAAVLWFADTASIFGLAHLVLEGAFVGGLAALEWAQREQLMTRYSAQRPKPAV